MDSKTLHVLEYPKILERLAAFCDFSASAALARALQPTNSLDLARLCLQETTEARRLLTTTDAAIGGVRDIRPQVDLARRGGVLEPQELLDIKSTLIAARELKALLEKRAAEYPRLSEIALALPATLGLVDAISRVLSDKGEILDSASPKLASLRAQVRLAYDRLMARLQKYLTDPSTASKLQETIITQRDGRYVIPLRAEFKGQVKSIVHDQSSTGATLFVEPLVVVELNNQYRELQLAERDEERRVLAELSAQVGAQADPLTYGVAALAELDLAFAKAKYADELHANEPIVRQAHDSRPPHHDSRKSGIGERESVIRLFQARHPLLDPTTVVAIDFDLPENARAVVITGPNTGGKTVALKTVGLLALMAQSGLHIPAQSGSELSLFQAVYADIGDEQSIEQSLSTFSGHVTNIARILKVADGRSLVILDELGAGTDPQEGAALARALLAHLLEGGITTLVTTHHPELKTFAHTTPGVVNASVEFDLRTLRPTYQLTIGLPGRSNALAIAQRLGLPEAILVTARSDLHPDDLRADKLLDDIHRQRKSAHKEREKAERARSEAQHMRRELAERLEKIEDERQAILEKARAEGEAQVAALQDEIGALKKRLAKARQPLDSIKAVIAKAEEIEEKVKRPVASRRPPAASLQGPLQVGEKVVHRKLGSEGVILAIDDDEAEIQAVTLRLRAKLDDLKRKEEAISDQVSVTSEKPKRKSQPETSGSSVVTRRSSLVASPGMDLHLRGKLVEDGLDELEKYLEKAYSAGLPFVRIVHGKGTGRMRAAVRAVLNQSPYVSSFEEAQANEGGAGATIAKFKS